MCRTRGLTEPRTTAIGRHRDIQSVLLQYLRQCLKLLPVSDAAQRLQILRMQGLA